MDGAASFSATETVAIALASGFAGSVFGVLGSFLLTWRTESRQRRARLKAMEYELRGNRLVIEASQLGSESPGQLSQAMWARVNVELALDVQSATYKKLQNFYWPFADAEKSCMKMLREEADEQEVKNVAYWRQLCGEAQTLVTGELHLSWRIQTRAMASWNRLKGFIPGRKKETQS